MVSFNYIGPINHTGYGIASASYFSTLYSLGIKIGYRPIGNTDYNVLNEVGLSKEDITRAHSNFDPSNPTFVFWHLHDILRFLDIYDVKGPKVAFSTFEVDGFSDQEKSNAAHFNVIATASTWGTQVLKQHFPNVADPIPHAFKRTPDEEIPLFNRSDKDILEKWQEFVPFNLDNPLILSTSGKFECRKGHPELFSACSELSKQRQVLLVASIHNPFIIDGLPYDYLNANSYAPFFFENHGMLYRKNNFYLYIPERSPTRNDLHNLLSWAHYFVSPSKAEGWNLPLFEMMSRGMPTITTLNTAHTDYCSPDSTIEILADGEQPVTKALDGRFFNGSFNWNNITHSSILSSLYNSIEVLEDSNQRNAISAEAVKLTSKFSWQQSATKIVDLMKTF